MKKKQCFECKRECPCECFELDTDYGCIHFCNWDCYNKSNKKYDWDAEFGEYEGHFDNCELGEHFKEKWKSVLRQLNTWRDMALRYNRTLHKIGYYKRENATGDTAINYRKHQ